MPATALNRVSLCCTRLFHGSLLLLCSFASPAVFANDLSAVVEQVLRQHPDTIAAQAMLNVADEQVKQARSGYFPTAGMELTTRDSREKQFDQPLDRNNRRAEAYLRWNLFRGLADQKALGASEYKRNAADADLLEAQEQIALQITQTYLEVLRFRRLLALNLKYGQDLQTLYQLTQSRVEAGRAAAPDLDQIEMTRIQVESQQSQIRGQLRGVEQQYLLLTGEKPGKLQEPALLNQGASLSDLENLKQKAEHSSYRLIAAQARVAAQNEEIGIANGSLMPSVDLEVRKRLYTRDEPAPLTDVQYNTQLTLSYQVPLGGENQSRKREAEDRKLAAEASAESELLKVNSELAVRWASWQETRRIEQRLNSRVEASRRLVEAYNAQYEAGRRSLSDLISSRGEYYSAYSDLISNRIEQITMSAQVLSLTGGLQQTLLPSN